MACGGLKFVEEKLSADLKKSSNVKRTLDLAIGMMNFINTFTYEAGKFLEIKIGIHYGNCIFGVLGYHKPQFSLIGDTVNTTSRCCTTGPNGKIILSEQAYAALDKNGEIGENYKFQVKVVEMKGKGNKNTFILQRKEDLEKVDRRSSVFVASNSFVPIQKLHQAFKPKNQLDSKNQSPEGSKFKVDSQNNIEGLVLDSRNSKEDESSDEISIQEENLNNDDFESIVDNESMQDNSEDADIQEDKNRIKNLPSIVDKSVNQSKTQKENEMLRINKFKVNVMKPFFHDNFKEFYLKQMMLKNLNKVFLSTLALMLSILLSAMTSLILSTGQEIGQFYSRLMELFCILALVLFLALYNADIVLESPRFSKIYLGSVIILSMSSRIVEIYVIHIQRLDSQL